MLMANRLYVIIHILQARMYTSQWKPAVRQDRIVLVDYNRIGGVCYILKIAVIQIVRVGDGRIWPNLIQQSSPSSFL